jgi:hypothetical protein
MIENRLAHGSPVGSCRRRPEFRRYLRASAGVIRWARAQLDSLGRGCRLRSKTVHSARSRKSALAAKGAMTNARAAGCGHILIHPCRPEARPAAPATLRILRPRNVPVSHNQPGNLSRDIFRSVIDRMTICLGLRQRSVSLTAIGGKGIMGTHETRHRSLSKSCMWCYRLFQGRRVSLESPETDYVTVGTACGWT